MNNEPLHIAIAYDFDGTLAPGNMQEHSFIPELGINISEFWEEANQIARANDADGILAYMQLMLQKAAENNKPISKHLLYDHGKKISFFKGVDKYFDRINAFAAKLDIVIDHYIISSGIREIIQGTPIAKFFNYIFASGYIFNTQNEASWPALAINYTTKTQYLFRINKGIINAYDDSAINRFVDYDKRPMPFSRMIYVGDGETDVPAMKMIKYQGGKAIAVYDPDKISTGDRPSGKQLCEKLIQDNRADYMAAADYSENSKLDLTIKSLLQIMSQTEFLNKL